MASIKLRIIGMGLVVFGLLGVGCGDDGSSDGQEGTGAATAKPSGGAGEQASPKRVEIEVGASGYDPGRVEAEAGQPLTLVFNRTTDEGCGQKLVIAAHGVEKDLPLNEPVEVSFTPGETGELRFTCGMDMYDGAIVVR